VPLKCGATGSADDVVPGAGAVAGIRAVGGHVVSPAPWGCAGGASGVVVVMAC
jgi:hypothetical protein